VKAFPKELYGRKAAENNIVGLLGYQIKRILSSERGRVLFKNLHKTMHRQADTSVH